MIENLFRPGHILTLLVVYVIFFGPQKLPEAAKALATAIKEFKKGMATVVEEVTAQVSDPTPRCHTCQGRGWIMKSETKDLGGGLGSGGSWNEPCPECARGAIG